ncbi:MAG: glycosyl transferase family 2 [Deltaproteobacteria bacterium]|nr:glycosyl transferase family 2 [Deltaproteobacteria bacterium]
MLIKTFSVIVVARDSSSTIEPALRALAQQTFPAAEFECIVVDDASPDGAQRFLEDASTPFELKVIRNAVALGEGASRNAAIAASAGKFVVLLGANMVPSATWLQTYAERACGPGPSVLSGQRLHIADNGRSYSQQELESAAKPGLYPDRFFPALERQLGPLMEAKPDSLVCAYSLLGANVAVRRDLFDATSGFNPSLTDASEVELGVRLWEVGATFGRVDADTYSFAKATPPWMTAPAHSALFRRHPYFAVMFMNFWAHYHGEGRSPPSPYDSLLSVADAATHGADFPLAGAYERIFGVPSPEGTHCDLKTTRELLASEWSDLSLSKLDQHFDHALARGVFYRRVNEVDEFNPLHFFNWLNDCTPVIGFVLEAVCKDPPPFILTPSPRTKVTGHYEVTVDAKDMNMSWRGATLTIPLPIPHQCQTELSIHGCQPPELLQYINRSKYLIELPIEQLPKRDDSFLVKYHYSFLSPKTMAVTPGDTTGGPPKAEDRDHSIPDAYLERAQRILQHLEVDRCAPRDAARRIFEWLQSNMIVYASGNQSYCDSFDTGVGLCADLMQIFVNLCRLSGIPARPRVGIVYWGGDKTLERQVLEQRCLGYCPLSHVWAEFCSEEHLWIPVEIPGYAPRRYSAANVPDLATRQKYIQVPNLVTNDLFGHVAHYRVYATPQVDSTTGVSFEDPHDRSWQERLNARSVYRFSAEYAHEHS